MPTDKTIVGLTSGNIRSFSFFHNYYEEDLTKCKILVLLEDNKLLFIDMDADSQTVLTRKFVLYKNKLLQVLNEGKEDWELIKSANLVTLSGYGFDFKDFHCLFIYMSIPTSGSTFLFQVNTDDLFNTVEVIAYPNLLQEEETFINVFPARNLIFTDNRTVDSREVYIIYLKKQEGRKPTLKGIQIAVTDEQKQELASNSSRTFPDTKYPIVDEWTGLNIPIMVLPGDTLDTSVNFSTGLSFLRFGS